MFLKMTWITSACLLVCVGLVMTMSENVLHVTGSSMPQIETSSINPSTNISDVIATSENSDNVAISSLTLAKNNDKQVFIKNADNDPEPNATKMAEETPADGMPSISPTLLSSTSDSSFVTHEKKTIKKDWNTDHFNVSVQSGDNETNPKKDYVQSESDSSTDQTDFESKQQNSTEQMVLASNLTRESAEDLMVSDNAEINSASESSLIVDESQNITASNNTQHASSLLLKATEEMNVPHSTVKRSVNPKISTPNSQEMINTTAISTSGKGVESSSSSGMDLIYEIAVKVLDPIAVRERGNSETALLSSDPRKQYEINTSNPDTSSKSSEETTLVSEELFSRNQEITSFSDLTTTTVNEKDSSITSGTDIPNKSIMKTDLPSTPKQSEQSLSHSTRKRSVEKVHVYSKLGEIASFTQSSLEGSRLATIRSLEELSSDQPVQTTIPQEDSSRIILQAETSSQAPQEDDENDSTSVSLKVVNSAEILSHASLEAKPTFEPANESGADIQMRKTTRTSQNAYSEPKLTSLPIVETSSEETEVVISSKVTKTTEASDTTDSNVTPNTRGEISNEKLVLTSTEPDLDAISILSSLSDHSTEVPILYSSTSVTVTTSPKEYVFDTSESSSMDKTISEMSFKSESSPTISNIYNDVKSSPRSQNLGNAIYNPISTSQTSASEASLSSGTELNSLNEILITDSTQPTTMDDSSTPLTSHESEHEYSIESKESLLNQIKETNLKSSPTTTASEDDVTLAAIQKESSISEFKQKISLDSEVISDDIQNKREELASTKTQVTSTDSVEKSTSESHTSTVNTASEIKPGFSSNQNEYFETNPSDIQTKISTSVPVIESDSYYDMLMHDSPYIEPIPEIEDLYEEKNISHYKFDHLTKEIVLKVPNTGNFKDESNNAATQDNVQAIKFDVNPAALSLSTETELYESTVMADMIGEESIIHPVVVGLGNIKEQLTSSTASETLEKSTTLGDPPMTNENPYTKENGDKQSLQTLRSEVDLAFSTDSTSEILTNHPELIQSDTSSDFQAAKSERQALDSENTTDNFKIGPDSMVSSKELDNSTNTATIAGVGVKTTVSVSLPLSKMKNNLTVDINDTSVIYAFGKVNTNLSGTIEKNDSVSTLPIPVENLNETKESSVLKPSESPNTEGAATELVTSSTSPPTTTRQSFGIRKPKIRLNGGTDPAATRYAPARVRTTKRPTIIVSGGPVSIFQKSRNRLGSITSSTTESTTARLTSPQGPYGGGPYGNFNSSFSIEPEVITTTTTEEPYSEEPFEDDFHDPTISEDEDVTLIKIAGSIVIKKGLRWVNQLYNRHSPEYKTQARRMHRTLMRLYRGTSISERLWKIEIDGFGETYPGSRSITVDYFLFVRKTNEVFQDFHLREIFNERLINNTVSRYTVDPALTEFEIMSEHRINKPTDSPDTEPPIPQWAIAVIVIGAASLIFIILFGAVTVYSRHHMRRRYTSKLSDEDLERSVESRDWENKMGAAYENLSADAIYDCEDGNVENMKKRYQRHDPKSISKTKHYDSWRTEWTEPPKRVRPPVNHIIF